MDNPYDAPAGPITGSVADRRFRHPGTLTRLVRLTLVGSAVTAAMALVFSVTQRSLLRQAEADGLSVDEAYAGMDLYLLFAPLLQILVLVGGYVIIGMWIYRMAGNTRALVGASKMDHAPGWAVGWFFIPFANLWKPYQAMKEIWALNATGARSPAWIAGGLLPLWWFLWLAWNIVSNVAGRLSWRATTFDETHNSTVATMISDAINIPLCLVFLLLVNRLYAAQMHIHAQQHEDEIARNPVHGPCCDPVYIPPQLAGIAK